MNPFIKAIDTVADAATRVVDVGLKAFSMVFGRAGGLAFLLPRTKIDYRAAVDYGHQSNLIYAVVHWLGRNFPEAPVYVERLKTDGETERILSSDTGPGRMLQLLERPNPFYSGPLLWSATIADFKRGCAYWIKLRNRSGRVEQLWWVPKDTIRPKWPQDGSAFISHFEYNPNGVPIDVPVDDVVRFPNGMDPRNTREGIDEVALLAREIFTDDEAANFSATLLANMAVPGVIVAPRDAGAAVNRDLKAEKQAFEETFGGDRRGSAMFMKGPTDVTVLSFSPQQMNLRELRKVPEERATSVMGIHAAVVGLGAGLDRSHYNNIKEAKASAWEEGIIPIQRLFAAELEVQLLDEFADTAALNVGFDLSNVRALQEDQDALWKRATDAAARGLITRAQFKSIVGQPTEKVGDEVHLVPISVVEVPVGEEPEQAQADREPEERSRRSTWVELKQGGRALAPAIVRRARDRVLASIAAGFEDDVAEYFTAFGERIRPRKARPFHFDPDRDVDWEREDRQLLRVLLRWWSATGAASYSVVSDQLGLDVPWDPDDPGVKAILAGVGARVQDITEESRARLRDLVAVALERGYSVEQLVGGVETEGFRGIRGLVGSWTESVAGTISRARTIALTETAVAYNTGSLAAYRASGLVEQVEVFDGTGDEPCAAAHGALWTLDQAVADPIAHPNCQRAFGPVVSRQAGRTNGHQPGHVAEVLAATA